LGEAGRGVAVQTFHSLGLDLLRKHAEAAGLPAGFKVLDEAARMALLGQVMEARGDKASARVASAISASKAVLVVPAELAEVCRDYQAALAAAGAVDFDDLVGRAVQLLETREEGLGDARRRCRHLLVDEYQDINAAQYRLIRLLAPADSHFCAVGDPDQAIYGFRGSDPKYFACFSTDYPSARTITLVRNYRSHAPIVRLATAVIESAPARPVRPLQALRGDGPAVERHVLADERAEADFIAAEIEAQVAGTSFLSKDAGRAADGPGLAFHEIAVLVRLSAQAEAIEESLDRAGIPCQRLGDDALCARPFVADILSRLRRHLEKTADVTSVADLLPTLVPESSADARLQRAVDLLRTLAVPFADDAASFLAEMALARETDVQHQPQKVAVLTLHASKGLEFPLVFIAGCEDGILPLRLPWLPPADADEERRLLYVGMTRARQRLILTAAAQRHLNGRAVENRACPYLDGLPAGLFNETRSAPRRRKARQLSLL
jgi:DNA helicase-2/ATP-dependent DNA helicase PcrA